MTSTALELAILTGGWLLAGYLVGNRIESSLTRRSQRHSLPPPGPGSAVWVRQVRTFNRTTTPPAAPRRTFF